jgi:hypothetical protein
MAKIKTPTPSTPIPETPTIDINILIESLASPLQSIHDADESKKSGILDAVVKIIEFKEENPTLERSDCKLAVQQAVANMLNIKIAKVQNSKANGGDDYAYTLASQMLNTAWPKGEKEQAAVKKAIDAGKGWVEVRKASAKRQKNPQRDPDAKKITKDNFASRLMIFLNQAQVDTSIPLADILDMADKAVDAIRNAPPA